MGRNWEDLIVFQKAHEFVLDIYRLLKNFPVYEKFALVDQMRRAAISIPANIVEGHTRKSRQEFLRFLYISRGSLEELKYFLLLSKDLAYISDAEYENYSEKLAEISYLLNQLIKSLTTSTTSTNLNKPQQPQKGGIKWVS